MSKYVRSFLFFFFFLFEIIIIIAGKYEMVETVMMKINESEYTQTQKR